MDGNRVNVRVYYPYFRVKNGEVGSLFDVFHPQKVTAFHLIRAARVLVPCPHLQFHFEEFWKLLLPEFTTLRTGIEWVDEVAWYYIQMVRCKTRYPHILSTPPAFDTWSYVNDYDWADFKKATSQNVMVGVSGDGDADARLVAIESLTPGTYLGGKKIYFPSMRLRQVFARKFEPFLPDGARTHVGEQESDGSPSRPHGIDHRSMMYYFMVKATDTDVARCVHGKCDDNSDVLMRDTKGRHTQWSREVTSGALTRYDDDDAFFCYDLNSELYDRRFRWYELSRIEAAKNVGPTFQWKSLRNLSKAMHQILTLRIAPRDLRVLSGDHRHAALATETLIEALWDVMTFGLKFAMVFDRMCLCVKRAIPCLASQQVRDLLSAFASMIITRVPEVVPRYAFACDDAFLLESLAMNMVNTLSFQHRDALGIRNTFTRILPRHGMRGMNGK